jgi:hypothetical protein
MKSIFISVLSVSIFLSIACAQDSGNCGSFQRIIKTTYNFKPSRLTASERDSKSEAMDHFWNTAKANSKELLPCLRAALQDPNADKWFRFDGSNLLVELDPSEASKAIQVRNYTDVDLEDVDLRTWVTTLSLRGFEGFDVSEAGSRWLGYPNAKYSLPEHGGYKVTVFSGAFFIFGSMDESQTTPALVKIISQPNHPWREWALMMLVHQATPESFQILKQLTASTFSESAQNNLRKVLNNPDLLKPRSKPKTSREEFIKAFQDMLNGDSSSFMELVSEVPDGEKDVVAVLKPEDLPIVRKIRRLIVAQGNQHSIEYYNSFTEILMAMVWKPELVK